MRCKLILLKKPIKNLYFLVVRVQKDPVQSHKFALVQNKLHVYELNDTHK